MPGVLSELLGRLPEDEANAEVQATQRRAKAKDDFFYFCQTYLGEAFPTPFADYQKALLRIVSNRTLPAKDAAAFRKLTRKEDHVYFKTSHKLEGLLDIEPRDHGKTTRNTQALPLWLALCHDEVFPVLVAASKMSSTDLIASIKFELEHNEQIIDDFGEQKTRTWNKRKIVLANGNAIAAVGAGQSLRGIKERFRRPTHVICDDLLKDNEVQSSTLRNTLYTWFKRVVMNLGKDALIIVVNTIMHPDDLPSRLLEEVKEKKLKNWIGLRFSAETPSGGSLWPQRWPKQALAKKREQLGPFVFATEWLNQPMADAERKFHAEWFGFYSFREIDPRKLKKVMAVDPATGKANGDYSAIVVVGKDPQTGLMYVLDAWGGRISDLALAAKIIELYLTHHPEVIRFEEVAFQAIYKREVAREGSRQGIHLPLKGYRPNAPKEVRIQALAPLVESQVLLFPRKGEQDEHKLTLLRDQLINFPKDHDDLPDALAMCVEGLETVYVGGVPIARQYGLTTAQKLARYGANVIGALYGD